MNRLPRLLLPAVLLLSLVAAAAAPVANDRKFTTSSVLSTEARTLVQVLEQAHYNRDHVSSADYGQAVPDYMTQLDGQHLFFLAADKAMFTEKYGKSVYYNTAFLGNVDAAYEIFIAYESRARARIAWIQGELKANLDLTGTETYAPDRTKANWPASAALADELWRKRLKFEVLGEVLNKKTPDAAREAVSKRYDRMLKNIGEIESSDLAEIYLTTIAQLYDPHSNYFSADTFEDFSIQMKLQLVGIGALLGVEDDICVVKEIVPGGPADLGRVLKPNDKIMAISETGAEPVDIIGMKLRKIVDLIRGQKGTDVHLTVRPGDATDDSARKEIIITRDIVKLNSARAHGAIFQVPGTDGNLQPLGVISLPAFYNSGDTEEPDSDKSSATKDVARLIAQMQQTGISGLVLDLRHNGGGYLTEAIDLAGLFIKQGPVVQVKNYNGEIQVDNDSDAGVAYAGPLAVLVDRFSASASEIVTGALQNYGRAVVIGDSSTHGKGTVQQVVEMKQVSRALAFSAAKTGAVKFTIQKYYLPSGDSTQLKGVIPDIVLPSIDDYLPIGEADLPHALTWDKIPTSFFDGAPLDSKVVGPLRQASLLRQAHLEEFTFLKKNVDWFKERQAQKQVSLNLEERKNQKAADDAFRKSMKAEQEQIARTDFTYKEFRLGPPPPPKVKPAKKPGEDEDDDELSTDETESYAKGDVHLRECLRVVSDEVALAQHHALAGAAPAPLAAALGKG